MSDLLFIFISFLSNSIKAYVIKVLCSLRLIAGTVNARIETQILLLIRAYYCPIKQ